MLRIKLLIADSLPDFRLRLADALPSQFEIRCCGNGQDALAHCGAWQPHILAVNMALPGLDGVTLLEALSDRPNRPLVVAMLSYQSAYLHQCLARLKVDAILERRDAAAGARLIRSLAEKLESPEPPAETANFLRKKLGELGFSEAEPGYPQLFYALWLLAQDSSQPLTPRVYPQVARRCGNDTGAQVGHLIRLAIHRHYDPTRWTDFPELPTNRRFLSVLAEELGRINPA